MGLDNSFVTVTFVTSQISPTFGIAAATVSLADILAADHNVHIVTIDSDDTLSFKHSSIIHRAWGDRQVLGWRRVSTLLRAFRHRFELDDGVIIVSGVWAAVPFLIASRKSQRNRTIVWEHSLTNQHALASKRIRLLRMAARPLYRRAVATVAVSDLVAEDLRHAGFGSPIMVIPNVIRSLKNVGRGAGEAPVSGRLVTVGALVKGKNQGLVLESVARLPANYTLDVVGDGPERAALEELADRLGVRDRVNFCGYVEDPVRCYESAQIVVHPCDSETFGLVLFEAADCRRPVVAPNGGMAARWIPDLVPGRVAAPNPAAFAAAIRSLDHAPISAEAFEQAAEKRRSLLESIVPAWRKLISDVESAAGR